MTCTCGEEYGQPGHYDVSPPCWGDRHYDCLGRLFLATGFHWWCACRCHPEPVSTTKSLSAARAFHTWKQARAHTA